MNWLRNTFLRSTFRPQPAGAPPPAESLSAPPVCRANPRREARIRANVTIASDLLAIPLENRPPVTINGCPVCITGLDHPGGMMKVEACDKDVRLQEMSPASVAHLPTKSVYVFDLNAGGFDIVSEQLPRNNYLGLISAE